MKGTKSKRRLFSGLILVIGFATGLSWAFLSWISLPVLGGVYVGLVYLFSGYFAKDVPEETGEDKGDLPAGKITEARMGGASRGLAEVEEALQAISEGDLSYRIDSSGERSGVLRSCRKMVNQLRELIGEIMRLSVILSSASKKWAEATDELNEITLRYREAVADLVKDNEEVVNAVTEAKTILEQINEEYVNRGQQIVEIQEEKMEENLDLMRQLTGEVSLLEEKTEDITLITETITELAEETNLLSLNASIEAARAARDGRAFNVIAEEIGDLASDSLDSSNEIMEIIAEVQEGIGEVVGSVEKTREGVEGQQETVEKVSALFDDIVKTTRKIERDLKEIDELASDSFAKTEQLDSGVEKQAGHVEYIAGQAGRMSEVSFDLQEELDNFQFIKLAYTEVEETSASVARELLERELGIGVVLVPLNYAEMYHSIARGILDGMVSSWVPKTHEKYLQKFRGDFVDLGSNLTGARIGLVVPDYLEVDTISDLREVDSLFRERKIYAIEATAGVTIAAEKALEDYGLEDWSVDPVGLKRVMTRLDKAVNRGEPVVITGWKPHWMFAEYSLKFLDDPRGTFGSTEEIHTVARPGLKEDNPRVYDILKEIDFEMEEYTGIMREIHRGKSPAEMAATYVEKNFRGTEAS